MITCKLTGKVGAPIKAHIVPRAFYELPPQEEGPLILISNTPNTFPEKVPVGIYDDTMVTQDGENIFQPWDDYAIKLLLRSEEAFKPYTDKGVLGWLFMGIRVPGIKALYSLSAVARSYIDTPRIRQGQSGST